jgi:hypothetical protein
LSIIGSGACRERARQREAPRILALSNFDRIVSIPVHSVGNKQFHFSLALAL